MFAMSSGQTRTLAGHVRDVLSIPVLGITGRTRTYPFRDVRLSGAQWREVFLLFEPRAYSCVRVSGSVNLPWILPAGRSWRGRAEPRLFTR